MATEMDGILERIVEALEASAPIGLRYAGGGMKVERKEERNDPVTEADRALNELLRSMLPRGEEGWFSEETVDDYSRMQFKDVWIVDPLDGTREFVQGIPEWAISIAFVRNGRAIAGGICNPMTKETIVGSVETGVTCNGEPAKLSARSSLDGAVVLASRSEVKRGQWDQFKDAVFTVKPVGSVAYKLGVVAAGRADATWTLVPKNEWDIAAGVALLHAGGGKVYCPDGTAPTFNNRNPLKPGLLAHPPQLDAAIRTTLGL